MLIDGKYFENRSIMPILATFYEFKSRFEKSWLRKVRRPIFNLMFSESTCSGLSKIRNLFFRELLG
jgi:hypothetical protein